MKENFLYGVCWGLIAALTAAMNTKDIKLIFLFAMLVSLPSLGMWVLCYVEYRRKTNASNKM